jgi:protein-disulfide isomerase
MSSSRLLTNAASLATVLAAAALSWSLLRPRTPVGPAVTPSAPQRIDWSKTKGNRDARVGLVEYADFECVYCAAFAVRALPSIEKTYISTGRVLFAFKHLPLPNHPQGWVAAQAAECAAVKGSFWPMHDLLFRGPRALSDADLRTHGRTLGLGHQFEECRAGDATEAINADIEDARTLGPSSTPLFVVGLMMPNGRLEPRKVLTGTQSASGLAAVLDQLLSATK